jgi:hypothetical protein
MSVDPPVSSQEALHRAMLETSNLRRRLAAARAGEVLDAFDRVEEIWGKQDEEQFPFSILMKDICDIKATVREAFGGELELPVDWRSPVYDQVVEFDQKIRICSGLMMVNPVYSGLEKRLQRIEEVLPPRSYAFRDLLDDLRPSFDLNLKQRLEAALRYFGSAQYELTITECGKAEGILFPAFKKILEASGITELPSNTGNAIGSIFRNFASHKDSAGLVILNSARLEFFLLSMFQTLHYFRNLGSHDRAEEVDGSKLPGWQVQRREYFTQRPEYARLTLGLTIQIALELQALLDHQNHQRNAP